MRGSRQQGLKATRVQSQVSILRIADQWEMLVRATEAERRLMSSLWHDLHIHVSVGDTRCRTKPTLANAIAVVLKKFGPPQIGNPTVKSAKSPSLIFLRLIRKATLLHDQ